MLSTLDSFSFVREEPSSTREKSGAFTVEALDVGRRTSTSFCWAPGAACSSRRELSSSDQWHPRFANLNACYFIEKV